MNKIFKVIWNHTTQSFVVTSEISKAHRKTKSTRLASVALAVAALMATSPSFAATVAIGGAEDIKEVGSRAAEAATATGSQAVAIGQKAKATETSTVALGDTATASNTHAVAVGYNTTATERFTVAVGVNAKAQAVNAVALGNNANATHSNSVVLGANSVSSSSNSVSVGSDRLQRKITYVANGTIAEDSFDAVNGGQLYTITQNVAELTKNIANVSGAKNYFHVNPSRNKVETGKATNLDVVDGAGGAKAPRSLAAGVDAQVESQYSMAIGDGATITKSGVDLTTTDGKTVAGHQQSSNSLAVGSNATVTGQKSVAIGYKANVTAPIFDQTSGVAIGDEATVNAKSSVAIGHWAVANATGQGSAMALGDQSEALSTYALAMGTRATASGDHSTAIAKNAKAYSQYGVSIGVDAVAGELKEESKRAAANEAEKKVSTIVLETDPKLGTATKIQVQDGKNVIVYTVKGYGETAIGKNTLASGTRSTAIGIEAQATGDRATAIANRANATAMRSTAIGNLANASSAYALAVGDSTQASGSSSMAVGQGANASGMNSGAIGKGANSTGVSGFAIGTGSKALENHVLAIGTNSTTNTRFGIAMGNEAQSGTNLTTGFRAVAIGNKAKALSNDSIAFGTNAEADAVSAIAIGRDTNNTGSASVAIGDNVTVSAARSVALGRNINVTKEENVVLGSWSTETSATITEAGKVDEITNATVGGVTYDGFAGTRSVGVVSFGRDKSDGEGGDGKDGERRLINVGAGKISADSTDAINGSQLYAVANSIPLTYTNKSGAPLVKVGDKFYNKADIPTDGSAPDPSKAVNPSDIIVSMISPNQNKTTSAPTTLTNVAGNFDGAATKADGTLTTAPTTVSTTSPTAVNNAATVGDILNAGWNLKHSDGGTTPTITDKDFVRHGDNVIFANGNGTTATITTDGTNSTIKYDVNVDGTTIIIENGKLKATAQMPQTTTLASSGNKVTSPDSANENKLVAAKTVADAINNSGFTLKTSAATGGKKLSGTDEVINPGDTIEMVAGKNLTVKQEANGTVTYATADDVSFTNVTSNTVTVPAANGNVVINNSGIDAGKNKVTNVADGAINATSKDAVNGAQIYALTGGTVTNVKDVTIDGVTYTNVIVDENGTPALVTYNVKTKGEHITNSVITAINNMNTEGIKFFHTNDGRASTARPADQRYNGEDSSAEGKYATAVGYKAQAKSDNSLAMGNNAIAAGDNAIAIGIGAQANKANTISIGNGNIVNGENSGAIGDPSKIDATDSYSVGNNNEIATGQRDVFALGNEIKKTTSNSVFLGSKSGSFAQTNAGMATNGVHTTTSTSHYTYKGENDANVAGVTDAVGVVSVGNASETRQIQGVAAGVISETSTDAINGSQLYYTNKAIGSTINNMGDTVNKLGDTVNKLGDTIHRNKRELRAGIAGSNAAAGLPQVYLPGKSMLAASAGTFKGEGALAVGYSRASDNGKLILKLQGNTNTRGDVGGSVGMGYQW